MKKAIIIVIILELLLLSTAQANYLSLEFENLGQKWQPRVGFFLEPTEELLIQFRQNMISNDSGALAGYNFSFAEKNFVINPNIGINIDTQLRVIYARPELQLFFKLGGFSIFSLLSAGLPIVEDKNCNLFVLGQAMYKVNDYYLGAKLEMLNDLEASDNSFINIGPRLGYLYNNFYFGLWGGVQLKEISAFMRVEIKLIF